jgi:hypothetical protein
MNQGRNGQEASLDCIIVDGKKKEGGLADQLEQRPDWIEFRTTLLMTLDRFPEAREAVLQVMRQRDIPDGGEPTH